jgi:hypothetical protein
MEDRSYYAQSARKKRRPGPAKTSKSKGDNVNATSPTLPSWERASDRVRKPVEKTGFIMGDAATAAMSPHPSEASSQENPAERIRLPRQESDIAATQSSADEPLESIEGDNPLNPSQIAPVAPMSGEMEMEPFDETEGIGPTGPVEGLGDDHSTNSRPVTQITPPDAVPIITTTRETDSATKDLVPERNSAEEKVQSNSRPKITIMYRTVLSRTPIYRCKGWTPEGRFRDKTLQELLNELPINGDADGIEGLLFTLDGPGLKAEQYLALGGDDRFEVMKKHFEKLIQSCVSTRKKYRDSFIFEMEIEPVRKDDKEKNEDEPEIELADW